MKTLGPTAVITANDRKAPAEASRPRLGKANTLARFALIGVALAAVVGTFAYLGGWFTPNALTPARLTDAFEDVDGVHPGFRRNHAKGVGVSRFFESNGNAVRLSKSESPYRQAEDKVRT
jgi:catalase